MIGFRTEQDILNMIKWFESNRLFPKAQYLLECEWKESVEGAVDMEDEGVYTILYGPRGEQFEIQYFMVFSPVNCVKSAYTEEFTRKHIQLVIDFLNEETILLHNQNKGDGISYDQMKSDPKWTEIVNKLEQFKKNMIELYDLSN